MAKRVLILGGAGFIGYHVARQLAALPGYDVTLVDNCSRMGFMEHDHDLKALLGQDQIRFSETRTDLAEPGAFKDLNERFDHVYLLASLIGARHVQEHPEEVIRVNTAIIMNTLAWIARVGCGRLFFASTSEVYAGSVERGIGAIPTDERVPVAILDVQHPRSTYALTKALGEAAVTHYAQSYGFEAVIARYHNIYGPRMGYRHVIPELMDRALKHHHPLTVYGVDHTRAFCYVTDAVEASMALMECPLSTCEVVHVGNPHEEVSMQTLLDKILALAEAHPVIDVRDAMPGAVRRRCPDIRKLQSLTGVQPRVDLNHGLALTWEWYARQQSRRHVTATAGGVA